MKRCIFSAALFHEDMHAEALTYMRQTLDYPLHAPLVMSPLEPDASDVAIGRSSLDQCPMSVGVDDGVQPRIHCPDLLEMCAYDLLGGNAPGPDRPRQPRGRRPDYVPPAARSPLWHLRPCRLV